MEEENIKDKVKKQEGKETRRCEYKIVRWIDNNMVICY